ncbi:MAG: SCO family protein [Geminicoccaceae bacterium]
MVTALAALLASLWVAVPAALVPPFGVPVPASVGGPFELVDQDGRAVSDRDFRGRPMLVYFGYTYCPDICPTTLQTLSEALAEAGAAGKVAFLFITIDPERDTPERLREYATLFDPPPLALTGSPEAVATAARAYRVFVRRHREPGQDDYAIDHSAYAYLMDSHGELIRPFRHGVGTAEVAASIRDALRRSPP